MSLGQAPIGCVPIVWNNVDQPALSLEVGYGEILDTFARLGFEGTQFGRGFPEGAELADQLRRRGLRFAELYSALPAGPEGLDRDALSLASRDLDRLIAAGGEVLVIAVHGSAERDALSGRVHATDHAPRWPPAVLDGLAALLDEVASAAPAGVRVAFHPHTATWVEAPDEVDALADRLSATRAGLCLDVGHYLVGGGDPVEAIRRHASIITHVHAKDVNPAVLGRLRAGELNGFNDAVAQRLFTELGNGALDMAGVVAALGGIGYTGWLMVEQDSTWLEPAEAAAIGGRVLRYAIRSLDR